MAKVELKQPIVKEISDHLDGADAAVLVDYRGLTVAEDTELRKKFREAGITYKVYKNTMLNFAVKGTEFEPLTQHLEGPTAIAISKDDATAPARIISEFMKNVPALELKGGVIEGTYYGADGIAKIADIPSRDVLISRLLGSMQSPVASLARVLNAIAEQGGAPAQDDAPAAEETAETASEAPAEETAEAAAEAPAEETAAENTEETAE